MRCNCVERASKTQAMMRKIILKTLKRKGAHSKSFMHESIGKNISKDDLQINMVPGSRRNN
jgi:phosphopantothenoylcysteine synthetase/decarboxylase